MFGLFGSKKEAKPIRSEYKLPHPEWSSFVKESDTYIAFSTMGRVVDLEMMEQMRDFGFTPLCVSTWQGRGRVIICEKLKRM